MFSSYRKDTNRFYGFFGSGGSYLKGLVGIVGLLGLAKEFDESQVSDGLTIMVKKTVLFVHFL